LASEPDRLPNKFPKTSTSDKPNIFRARGLPSFGVEPAALRERLPNKFPKTSIADKANVSRARLLPSLGVVPAARPVEAISTRASGILVPQRCIEEDAKHYSKVL